MAIGPTHPLANAAKGAAAGSLLGPIGTAVGAGASILGSALQRSWQKKMWDRQNRYNAPSAQVGRYRDAGINPNMVIGGGGTSAGNAGPVGSYQKGEIGDIGASFTNQMAQYQNIRNQKQQVENMKSDKNLVDKKAITETVRALSIGAQANLSKGQLNRLNKLLPAEVSKYQSDAEYASDRIGLLEIQKRLTEGKVTGQTLSNTFQTFKNELWEDNKMTMSDATWLRMFTGFLKEAGISDKLPQVKQWIEEQTNKLQNLGQNRPGVKNGKNWRDRRN